MFSFKPQLDSFEIIVPSVRALLLITPPKEEGRPDRFESLQPCTLLQESNLIIVAIIFACSRVFKEQNSSYLLSN